jgi:hypothetical protein
MTAVQAYLEIGVAIVGNAAMLLLFQQSMHRQLDAIRPETAEFIEDVREIRAAVKPLTGKVYERVVT